MRETMRRMNKLYSEGITGGCETPLRSIAA